MRCPKEGRRPETHPVVDGITERRLANFTGAGYSRGRPKVVQMIWFAVMNALFLKWWFPATARPLVLRMFGAYVGSGVLIRHGVRVHLPWKLRIGDNCWIGEGAWLINLELIDIESNVCISQEAVLCSGGHDHADPQFEYTNAPISVGAGSWIAARAMVLAGVVLPAGSLVPGGAVLRSRRTPRGHAKRDVGN